MLTSWLIDDVCDANESRAATRQRVEDYLFEPTDERERAEWVRAKAEREMVRRRQQVERQASMLVTDEDLDEQPVVEVTGIGPIIDPMLVQD